MHKNSYKRQKLNNTIKKKLQNLRKNSKTYKI